MTPIHYIVITWSVFTCIATVIMLRDAEDSKEIKDALGDYARIYSPKFIFVFICIAAFIHSFFLWWQTIPRFIVAWLKMRATIWVIYRILKAAETGNSEQMAKLKKALDVIQGKEKGKDQET